MCEIKKIILIVFQGNGFIFLLLVNTRLTFNLEGIEIKSVCVSCKIKLKIY